MIRVSLKINASVILLVSLILYINLNGGAFMENTYLITSIIFSGMAVMLNIIVVALRFIFHNDKIIELKVELEDKKREVNKMYSEVYFIQQEVKELRLIKEEAQKRLLEMGVKKLS